MPAGTVKGSSKFRRRRRLAGIPAVCLITIRLRVIGLKFAEKHKVGKNDTLDKGLLDDYDNIMENLVDRIDDIKESILKFVPAKYIYLFGSYAYGTPTEESDIDIYTVIPDGIKNLTELYAKIIVDLSYKKIYLIDLFLNNENIFNKRKIENLFERTIYQKGKVLYEH
jgi:predicted nucleotidyltransferase